MDSYNYPFMRREHTMYLSTINKQDFPHPQPYVRHSSFLQNDIPGTRPKILIPSNPNPNFALSTYVQPVPNGSLHIKKRSDPLFIDDIEGARSKASQFRTRRVVDPLCPKYVLPTAAEIVPDSGRPFIRDTLKVEDISAKRTRTWQKKQPEPIQGSSPSRRLREVKGISRLEVNDINKDGQYQTKRTADPLQPQYSWRDDEDQLNHRYGAIEGARPKELHPSRVNRPNDLCLGIKDIEGSNAGSFFGRSHFVDKRREFRNYMITQDIEKSSVCSLKKGIVTNRITNPLMPNYQCPGSGSS